MRHGGDSSPGRHPTPTRFARRRRRLLARVPAFVCGLLVAAMAGCGGAAPEPQGPLVLRGPPRPWDDMTHAERKQHMREVVRPTMARLFREHDPREYEIFGCITCHGDDFTRKHYGMPNALPPLYPSGTPEQRRLVDRHAATARFMFNTVLPTMTKLLGQPAYDPATKAGFTCFRCHPRGVSSTPAPHPAPNPASRL